MLDKVRWHTTVAGGIWRVFFGSDWKTDHLDTVQINSKLLHEVAERTSSCLQSEDWVTRAASAVIATTTELQTSKRNVSSGFPSCCRTTEYLGHHCKKLFRRTRKDKNKRNPKQIFQLFMKLLSRPDEKSECFCGGRPDGVWTLVYLRFLNQTTENVKAQFGREKPSPSYLCVSLQLPACDIVFPCPHASETPTLWKLSADCGCWIKQWTGSQEAASISIESTQRKPGGSGGSGDLAGKAVNHAALGNKSYVLKKKKKKNHINGAEGGGAGLPTQENYNVSVKHFTA